ncbi:hypothetical protein [Amycolatopsis sp. PS_44_ISF1]|uniref:hypothetical protein n=1 Tax=Amycolatopsis sp. PS_44_ISF1 TaxID=2974917 RepID=UPI0028DEB4D2|nr:hypothetical protein [Amycolatopsis sp. PS_44_ISF1]MDT8910125.1 hypothetical protein [Amycolatopsis sp. PS_44_ISF1]
MVIEFGEDGPSLKRIQIVDVTFPPVRSRRRRRQRAARQPGSWPAVAGLVVCGWPEAARAAVVALALGVSTSLTPSGVGAVGTAVSGMLCVLALRGSRTAPGPVAHQVP